LPETLILFNLYEVNHVKGLILLHYYILYNYICECDFHSVRKWAIALIIIFPGRVSRFYFPILQIARSSGANLALCSMPS